MIKQTSIDESTKVTLTMKQLVNLVEEAKRPEMYTKPFEFHHAKYAGRTERTLRDVYGREMTKVYDVVDVYTSETSKPYLIWTQKDGRALAEKLNSLYAGQVVQAVLKFEMGNRDRIGWQKIRIVDASTSEPEATKDEPVAAKKPEQLELDLFEEGEDEKWTSTKDTDWGKVFYYYPKTRPLHFAMYRYDDDPKTVYLCNVFVDDEARGTGLGNDILDLADIHALLMGANEIRLKVDDTNDFAHSWYLRHGFEDMDRHDDAESRTWLRKILLSR